MFLFANENLERFYFRQPWPLGVLFLLTVCILFFSAFLYGGERSLAIWKRILLGSLRASIFIAIVLILFEPVGATSKKISLPSNIVIMLDVSESMAFADRRQRAEDLHDAALALNKIVFSEQSVPEGIKSDFAAVPRIELARGILQHPDLKVFQKPGDKHRLRYFSFGERLEAGPDEPAALLDWLKAVKAQAPVTRLGESLQQIGERFAGQPTAAVILLTDGGSNAGIDPLEAARSLGAPVFPIGIGTPRPDDIRLLANVVLPETIFPKDKVPIRVQVESTPGFKARDVELSVKSEGRVLASKPITLKGTQFEELTFVPEQTSGLLKLDIGVAALPGEATEENNRVARTVKVIDDKIKVLYVEGKPRWEYRYLRAVLLRDHRMAVKFLMTEGDPDLAKASEQYIDKLPEDEKSTFDYDMVILGEVPASYLSAAQLGWLEKLVRDKGGSLLMLAGHQHAPMTYADTPIAKLLPVKLAAGGRDIIEAGVHPVVTQAGAQSQIMALEPQDEDNQHAWSLVKPLYDLPRLSGVRPGATVLATLSNQGNRADPYPLIAWQRYGGGKTMFVGSDQLWRLRFKRGDAYHAHFWSQSIQFLALSRLLGENKRIRLETDRKNYQTTDRVLIQATVLDEDFHPLKAASYQVLVEQVPPKGEPRTVTLKPVPNIDGMYQGFITAEQDGNFQVRTLPQSEGSSNRPDFQIEAMSREKRELDLQVDQLKKLAELTGGKYLMVRDLPKLHELIPDQSRVVALPPQEAELWNSWWVFAFIVSLAGVEWFMRRSSDVA